METFCVIGDRDSILGYQLAGAEGWPAADEAAARKAFRDVLALGSCRVLILLPPADAWLKADVLAHRQSGRPPVVAAMAGLQRGADPSAGLVKRMQAAIGFQSTEPSGEKT